MAEMMKMMEKMMSEGGSTAMCPMSSMCKGMMEKPKGVLGLLPLLLGVLLVALGVLVIVKPQILVWIAGGLFVLVGFFVLWMVMQFRRLGARQPEPESGSWTRDTPRTAQTKGRS
ncbi:MAG: hypothetical protein ACYTDY_01000 [Planctomycetota bacterium]|jgi:hypothetical protein